MNSREFLHLYMKINKERDNRLEKLEAELDIEELMDLITDIVVFDEDVKFKNKGKFTLLNRKSRFIGDLYNKEKRIIHPKKKFKFEQSKMVELAESN